MERVERNISVYTCSVSGEIGDLMRVHESEFRSVIRFLREGWEGIGRNFIYSGEQKFESIVIQRDRGRGRGRRRVSE